MARTIPGSVSTRTQAQKNGESASVLDFDTTGYANKGSGWCTDGTVASTLDRISGSKTRFTNTVGAVVNLLIQAGGSGYTHATITIAGGGSGAAYTATISGGVITAVTLVSAGSGYSPATTVTVTGDGSGAVLVPMVSQFPCVGALIYVAGAGATSRTYAGTVYSAGETSYTTNSNDPNGPTTHTSGPGAFNFQSTIASLADEVIAGTGIYSTAVFASNCSRQPAGNGSASFAFGVDAGPAFLAAASSGIADLKVPFGNYMVNASVNLAQMIAGAWHFVQRVYSEGPRSPQLIFTQDLEPGFCFQGSFLLSGDPNFVGEVDTPPMIDGLTIWAALAACKYGYFAEDMVTDPATGKVVQAGTLGLSYLDQARVRNCWLFGYYDSFICDPKRLSKAPADDPLPEELTGLGGVGVFFPKGAACAENHNFIRNFGIAVRTDQASHAIMEHSLHYYCGVAWYHQPGPGKDEGGADNCHYSHNKPISWTRAGIFVSSAARWLGGSGGGFNGARILNTIFESTFYCTVGTAAERAIVDRDGTGGLWIDNCTLPNAFGNTEGAACIDLQPVRCITISKTIYSGSLSTSQQLAFSPANYSATWQTNVVWRDNQLWEPFEFPGVQQGDLDPLLWSPSNQVPWSGGNCGNFASAGSSWSFVQDPVAGWTTTPAAQSGAYYFAFPNIPVNTSAFYIEIEGIVNEASGVGLHSGQYDWGYLGIAYYDSTLPASYAGVGLGITNSFLGFTNNGIAQKKRIYVQIPATQSDPNTGHTYTITPQAGNNPQLIVSVVSTFGQSAAGYGLRIRSVRLVPIDTTAPPAYLTSGTGKLANRATWKTALGITNWSPLDQGAAGDGITDDTAAIMAAIAAYGYLYLPPGVSFAHSGISLTQGIHIFGGGALVRLGDGPSITVDGTNSSGAYGSFFEDITVGQYNCTANHPVFDFINAVQVRIDGVYAYNNMGPVVSLTGNGTGFGYCEQVNITRLYSQAGGTTDIIQINSAINDAHVNNVVVALGIWVNYTGYAVNNVSQGSGISLVGNICIAGTGGQGLNGTATCIGNQGIPDTAAANDMTFPGSVTVEGATALDGGATVAGGLAVTGGETADTLTVTGASALGGGATVTHGTTTDTLSVSGAATLEGGATIEGGTTITGGATSDTLGVSGATTLNGNLQLQGAFAHTAVAASVTIPDPTTLANWRAALGIVTSGPGAAIHSPLDQGAAGNGSTDDTAAINAAIAAYGYLYLPPGVNFLAASGITITTGIRVFGGGAIITNGANPALTLNGTSSSGALGFVADGVGFKRFNGATSAPAISIINAAQATLNCVEVYNANGPGVAITGNGSGFGYAEQIVILGLVTFGGVTDVIQIDATPNQWHVNLVTIGFSQFSNYSGYALNNVSQGAGIYLVGNMSSGGSGNVTGTVYCLANIGIGDSMAALTITGAVTLSGSIAGTGTISLSGAARFSGGLTVTDGTATDTLAVSGATTLTGRATMNGGAAVTNGTSTDTLSVSGTSTFTGKATMNGGATVTNGTSTDTLSVSGASTLTGKGTMNGGVSVTNGTSTDTLSVSSTSTLTGKATMNGGAAVTNGTSTDTLSVSSTSTLTGKATMNGGAAVTNGTSTDSLSISTSVTHSGVAQSVTISDPTTKTNWRNAIGIAKCQLFSPLDQGAAGNGSTDDTAALNAAISAYGYLYLPPGYTFNTSSGITITSVVPIFGGGKLQTSGTNPTLTLNGTNGSGLPGIIIQDVAIARYNGSTANPCILVENVYDLTIDCITAYNSNGAVVSLVGNGSGWGSCAQITITRVTTVACTDGVQINSTPGAWNVCYVTVGFCRFINFTGYVVNNIAQGSELYLIGTIAAGSGSGVSGTVTCVANAGIADAT